MKYWENTYTKNIHMYLKFEFHWVSCILSSNLKYGTKIIEDGEREERRLINIPYQDPRPKDYRVLL